MSTQSVSSLNEQFITDDCEITVTPLFIVPVVVDGIAVIFHVADDNSDEHYWRIRIGTMNSDYTNFSEFHSLETAQFDSDAFVTLSGPPNQSKLSADSVAYVVLFERVGDPGALTFSLAIQHTH